MHTAYFYKYTIPKIERIFNSILPCDNYHVYVVFKINKFLQCMILSPTTVIVQKKHY